MADLVENEIPFFWYPKTVDFAHFRSFFIKTHSLVFLFSVDFREIFDVLFWALLKTVDIRGVEGLLLLELALFREQCLRLVNENAFKKNSKKMTLCRFFSLGIGNTKVHCIQMASVLLGRTTKFELSFFSFFQNSNSFGIFLCEVCQPYRFQNAYSLGIFLCEVCQLYRFQNSRILLVTA